MNKINSRILIAVVIYIIITIISFSVGWWIIGIALIAGGGFVLYRISGASVGITQLDFLKKIPGNKSWWTYGLVVFSTLYYVLLGFGVIKWGWVQFNVLIMLLIIALSAILAGSKDIPSTLQGVMKLWATLSIAGILALMIAIRFTPGLIQSLDYSNSSAPPAQQSAGQQEQVAPAPVEEDIDKGAILPRTNNPIYLTKSWQYEAKPGKYRLCFSWLGDRDGYYNQWISVNGVDYKSAGGNCYPIEITSTEIIVNFINPSQRDDKGGDTYRFVREYGGQGLYPFIETTE
jgi:hypothetical protein